jgi:senataxin
MRFVLSVHIAPTKQLDRPQQNPNGTARPQVDNPLARGGKDGLGIGFRIYINAKFNQSQKEAIIAAATEYGDGGFTLVKGMHRIWFYIVVHEKCGLKVMDCISI